MKKRNDKQKIEEQILKYLDNGRCATTTEISRKTKIHFYIVSNILSILTAEKKLEKFETDNVTIYLCPKKAGEINV